MDLVRSYDKNKTKKDVWNSTQKQSWVFDFLIKIKGKHHARRKTIDPNVSQATKFSNGSHEDIVWAWSVLKCPLGNK